MLGDGTAKTSGAIQELFKDSKNKQRLKFSAESHLETIEAATTTTRHPNSPATIAAPWGVPAHPSLYHTPVAKDSVPEKFEGTQGVKAKVFSIQLQLPMHACFPMARETLSWPSCTYMGRLAAGAKNWPEKKCDGLISNALSTPRILCQCCLTPKQKQRQREPSRHSDRPHQQATYVHEFNPQSHSPIVRHQNWLAIKLKVWILLLISGRKITNLASCAKLLYAWTIQSNTPTPQRPPKPTFSIPIPWISSPPKHTQQATQDEDNASWTLFHLWKESQHILKLPGETKDKGKGRSANKPHIDNIKLTASEFGNIIALEEDGKENWQEEL